MAIDKSLWWRIPLFTLITGFLIFWGFVIFDEVRDNPLHYELTLINCGNVTDTYYDNETNECVMILCERIPFINLKDCRYAGRNITHLN